LSKRTAEVCTLWGMFFLHSISLGTFGGPSRQVVWDAIVSWMTSPIAAMEATAMEEALHVLAHIVARDLTVVHLRSPGLWQLPPFQREAATPAALHLLEALFSHGGLTSRTLMHAAPFFPAIC
jgi:hypothetical protein